MRGVILAGGDSRRLGSDKAMISWDGEPLWLRQFRVLRDAGAERVALVRKPGQPVPEGVPVLRDRWSSAGPLAGLHAALAAETGPWVAVLAADMPGIDAPWFRWLFGFCRARSGAMVRHAGALEPLAAIYPAEAAAEIERRLERHDLSLQRLGLSLAAAGRMRLLPLSQADVGRVRSLNTAADAALIS